MEKSGNFVVKDSFSANLSILIQSFLGEHGTRSPKTVLDTHKNLIVVWKSHGEVREFHSFWRLDTLKINLYFAAN